MTEKEQFLACWKDEWPITKKVFEAYPEAKLDWRPHEKSKSARELMWLFPSENKFLVSDILKGSTDWSKMAEVPKEVSKTEIIRELEESCREVEAAISRTSETELNAMMKFPVAPKQMGDFRIMDVVWMFLMDQIHHRGQFSVYIRLAGGRVPSIYGPSADEPWE